MKNKKNMLSEHDLEYKKVPKIGTSGWMAILGVLFIIGLAAYYKYFLGKEILTCTKNQEITLMDKKTPYSVSFKLSFKDKVYVDGEVVEKYDLYKYSSDAFDIINRENLCGKVFIPKDKENIYNYSQSSCKQNLDDKEIVLKSSYNIKTTVSDVKINTVKSSFEKEGFTCVISK